jgi:hypothetical protein
VKLDLIGFTDNTYSEVSTINLDNVMSFSSNAEDFILSVTWYEGEQRKTAIYTSLQWAKGLIVTP